MFCRDDENAHDMYIPAMGFITYILLAGYSIGLHGDFSPEKLGEYASGATGWLILEVLVTLMVIFLLQVVQIVFSTSTVFLDSIRSRIPGHHRLCWLQIRPDHPCSCLWRLVKQPRGLYRSTSLWLRCALRVLGQVVESPRSVECCCCSWTICCWRYKKVCFSETVISSFILSFKM